MVVLVVDDDPVSRLVAEHILRSGGHEVVGAESAEEARQILDVEGGDIALIVCDYNMPGANGLDLLDELHRDEVVVPCPPFILLTGVGEEDELDDARAGDVSGYLTKPVQSGELLEMASRLAVVNAE
ncbi:MAG: response regulator [Actinomycetota bacterium]